MGSGAKDGKSAKRLVHKLGGKQPIKSKVQRKTVNKHIQKKEKMAGKRNTQDKAWGGFSRCETKLDPGQTMPRKDNDRLVKGRRSY